MKFIKKIVLVLAVICMSCSDNETKPIQITKTVKEIKFNPDYSYNDKIEDYLKK